MDDMISTGERTTVHWRDGEQFVRLPEGARFDTEEVTVRREGDSVVLGPAPRKKTLKAWLDKVRDQGGFDDDVIEAALDRPKDFGPGRRDDDIDL